MAIGSSSSLSQLDLNLLLQSCCKSSVIDCITIKDLIEKGADVKFKEPVYGETALHLACQNSHFSPNALQLLLDSGADVNAKDCFNRTPLAAACANNNFTPEHLDVLLGAEASMTIKTTILTNRNSRSF